MTRVCGNLLGSLSRGLKQNAEWRMELLDAGFPDSSCRRTHQLAVKSAHPLQQRNFTERELTLASNLARTVAGYSRRVEI